MFAAVEQQFLLYFGMRPPAARRWTNNVFAAMATAAAQSPVASPQRPRWTAGYVKAVLAEAASTLQLIPLSARDVPSRLRSFWPPTVNEWGAYGSTNSIVRKQQPTGEQLARLDVCLEQWLWKFTEDARLIVWHRACGVPWPSLAQRDGRSERFLRYRYELAIDGLVTWLSKAQPRTYPFLDDSLSL
jgi:hypothetical protein